MGAPVVAKVLTTLIFSVGIGLATKAFGRKRKSTVEDSKPATLTDRGSRVSLVIGRTRGGPIFAEESNRRVAQEAFANGVGGKGVGGAGGGNQNDVHFADGWHIISVGPAFTLEAIYENGEKIFPPTGGVPFRSHINLSGTTVPLEPLEGRSRGTLRLYWGEDDQPQNLDLNNRLGYASNHAFLFHAVWTDKRLGGSGTWPTIEYEYSVHPYNAGQLLGVDPTGLVPTLGPVLDAGTAWTSNGLAIPAGAPCPDILIADAGPPATIKVQGNLTIAPTSLVPDDYISIEGQGAPIDGRYQVSALSYNGAETIDGTGTIVDRPSRTLPSQWTTTLGAYVDLAGTGTAPPGISPQPFTVGTGIHVVRFRLDKAGIPAGNAVALIPLVPSNPDPDPGAGSNVQFNPGVNRMTVYVHTGYPGSFLDTKRMHIGFATGAGGLSRGVVIERLVGSPTTTITAAGGATFIATDIGNEWSRIDISYRTGDGATPPTATSAMTMRITVEDGIGLDGFGFDMALGDGQRGSTRFVRYGQFLQYTGITTITLQPFQDLTGLASFVGRICPLKAGGGRYQGANPAHILYQLLFETAPHGLGLDPGCYDIQSLIDMGLALSASGEGIRSHVTITDGNSVSNVVDALLQEIGCAIVWDVIEGVWTFVLTREKLVPDAQVSNQLVQPAVPSRSARFGEIIPSRLSFTYLNVDLRYRQDAVLISDDGTSIFALRTDVETIELRTVNDPEMAIQLGELRSLWEFAQLQHFTVVMDRNAAVLRTGDLLDFQNQLGTDVLLRVLYVQVSSEAMTVEVGLVSDAYAQRFVDGASQVTSSPLVVEDTGPPEDCVQRLWELSAFLGQEIQFASLRVSSDAGGPRATLLSSVDDASFAIETSVSHLAGGKLATEFMAAEVQPESDTDYALNRYHIENGPLITACNDTFGDVVQTLTDADWYAGRQWLVIGDEVMYVREFMPFGGTLWQAMGVLRARLDTTLQDHDFEDAAFVVVRPAVTLPVVHIPTAARGFPTYWKLPPGNTAPGLVPSVSQVVEGRGVKPMAISNFTTPSFSPGWVDGEDLTLRWDFRLPQGMDQRTGSGMQGYGEATGDSSAMATFPGVFRLTLTDPTLAVEVVAPVDVTTPSWTISGAALTAAIASAGLSATTDLRATMGPIYANGQVGDRVTVLLEYVA